MVRDPLSWSFPLGRLFGINIRIHILFPVLAVGLILRRYYQKEPPPIPGAWKDAAVIVLFLFCSVFLHEFGHCLGGRWMEGDAQEILLWPLGGLATVEVPHTPQANFVTAACGPLVNLGLCVLCAGVLIGGFSYWPPLNPLDGYPGRFNETGAIYLFALAGGPPVPVGPDDGLKLLAILAAWLFWVNWLLFLLNLVLVGFPFDGGRMLQAILWRYSDYRQATLVVVFAGFLVMFLLGLYAFIMRDFLALGLAWFTYVACRQEWMLLESGGEEGQFGYDFSQGYTSLERDQPPTALLREGGPAGGSAGSSVEPLSVCSANRKPVKRMNGAWTSCWKRCSVLDSPA